MAWKKIILLVGLLLLLAGIASAQEPTIWTWREAGLQFAYPADWTYHREQGYEFILAAPPDPATGESALYVWLQTGLLPEDQTLESLITGLGEQFGATVTPITFGGVEAFRLDALNSGAEANVNVVSIGFMPQEGRVGLLSIQGPAADWANIAATVVEPLLASAQVTPLVIDKDSLNTQLQASLAAQNTLSIGDPAAPVKMVEVLDYSCPHCVNYSTAIDRVIQDYVETGKVQLDFVFVTFVGQDFSEIATHAMLCATSQGYGWNMHELLIEGYGTVQTDFYSEAAIRAALGEAAWEGFDPAAWDTCMADKPFQQVIDDNAVLAQGLDVTSTPSLLYAVAGDEAPTFMLDPDGEALRGGTALAVVYSHLDSLLGAE